MSLYSACLLVCLRLRCCSLLQFSTVKRLYEVMEITTRYQPGGTELPFKSGRSENYDLHTAVGMFRIKGFSTSNEKHLVRQLAILVEVSSCVMHHHIKKYSACSLVSVTLNILFIYVIIITRWKWLNSEIQELFELWRGNFGHNSTATHTHTHTYIHIYIYICVCVCVCVCVFFYFFIFLLSFNHRECLNLWQNC